MEEKKIVQPVEIPIMHCFDNNYVIPAAVSFYSMLKNADPQYNYRLFVLHSDITVQNQQKLTKLVRSFKNADLEFINMYGRFDDLWQEMSNTDHLSKEVLYKLLAPEIFPQYDKLIITDVDVVFLRDISPSYFLLDNHSHAYFAGVRQINPDKSFLRPYYEGYKSAFSEIEHDQIKVCGGYLVANLKKLREDNMVSVFTSYLKHNSERLMQAEQDVINFCCRDNQIIYLSLHYVVCSYMYGICTSPDITASDPHYSYVEMRDAMEHPIQLHYATKTKPWNAPESIKAKLWYDYLNDTDFAKDFVNKKAYATAPVSPVPCHEMFSQQVESAPVKISIVVCSYNHEKLIKQALMGILNQKTKYSYEIIVADDASKDETPNIIRAIQQRYPDKMRKCILRDSNVGIGMNYYEALSLAEGEYLAICDGDDCWTDEHKLEKQIDFLEQNNQFTVVCSDYKTHEENAPDGQTHLFDIKKYLHSTCSIKNQYSIHDLIFSRFIASCTMVLRWKLKDRVPEFLGHYKVIDFPLALIHASCGYIKVFFEPMALYNLHSESITHSSHDDVERESIDLVAEVNQFLDYKIEPLYQKYMKALVLSKKAVAAPPKKGTTTSVMASHTANAHYPATTHYQWIERLYAYYMPEPGKNVYRFVKKNVKLCYQAVAKCFSKRSH